jgi:hypothetical protein
MASTETVNRRQRERDNAIAKWAAEHTIDLVDLDDGQRWVVFAALRFLDFVEGVAPLRRLVGYLLCHCSMDLTSPVVAAIMLRGERAVRKARQIEPAQFWSRMQKPRRGHRPSKLLHEHVGQIARYLVSHRKCSVAELLAFIKETFDVEMDRLTLRRFLKRYGLGCLRQDIVEDAPLLSAAPFMAVPSS